jgi:hypothetical protein
MVCKMGIDLEQGVCIYAMELLLPAFILVVLWIIESFEPKSLKTFELKVEMGDDTDARRTEIEAILRRARMEYELRASSDTELCYDVRVPLEVERDQVTNAILALDPAGHAAVDWSEKKAKNK